MDSMFARWAGAFALVAAAVTTVSPAAAERVEALAPSTEAEPALASQAPQRFADTRPGAFTFDGSFAGAGRRPAGTEYEVQIAGRGSVPSGATGAILNVAAVGPSGPGFLTVHPCGTRPNASALNYQAGVTIANEVVAALSASGSVCVFTLAETHLLIDVVGHTMPSDSLKTLSPQRFAESREGLTTIDGQSAGFGRLAAGSTTTVRIAGRGNVPADASAAIVNVGAVNPDLSGFITVHPCLPAPPVASSLNYTAGVTRANELITQLDATGDICVYTRWDVDLIVDVVGYVEADSDLVSLPNARFAETRDGQTTFDGINQGGGKPGAQSTTVVQIAGRGGVPADAVAVVANVAAVNPEAPGFLTAYPCDVNRPTASSLNYLPGVNGANEIIASLDDDGRLCLFTLASSHLLVDVVGFLKPNADLTIAKDGGVDAVIVGDTITYTIEVTNNGPDDAAGVGVTDVLPADVTFVSTTGCAEDPNGVADCTLGDIAAGGSASYTIEATIERGAFGDITNTATVSSSTGDPDLANNATSEITDVDQVPPVITSDGGGESAVVTVDENQIVVTDVETFDNEGDTEGAGLTYSLTTTAGGGGDNGLFTVDVDTGELEFATAPNFETPGDTDTDNDHDVQVTVTDSTGLTDVQDIVVTVTDVNEPPEIFSDGGGSTATVAVSENTTAATDVQTADVDGDTEGAGLTYALTALAGGGADNTLFTLDPATGVLSFTDAPDFELPLDADGDNDHEVQVTVTDSGGLTDVQDITVSVTDGNELPTIISDGGGDNAAVDVDENTTSVTDVDSSDDADSEGSGLTYALTPTGASFDNGLFTLDPDTGELTFTTAPDFETPGDQDDDNVYVVQVTVTDSGGLTDLQNILVTVLDIADESPVAVDDEFTVDEDTQLVVAAPGVLDNDTDPELDVLTVVLPSTTSSAQGGTVALTADGSFTYDPPADFSGVDTFTYEAVDAAGSNTVSNTATVTITVDAVNDEPSFTPGASPVALLEDSGEYDAAWATAIDAGGGETQGVDFVVTNNTDPALFSSGPAIRPDGDLSFTPAADANGSATITIELVDDGGTTNGGDDTSAPVDLTIDVTAVNDDPSFTSGANVYVAEDSGAYTEAGWATTISVGPADESGQTPIFLVTANVPGLFSTQPAISATGELTFTPADDANGVSLVSVTLMDDGGTADGGDDTSDPQAFLVTVTSVNDVPDAVDDAYTVDEGDTLTVPSGALVGVADNDTDAEDGTPAGDVTLVTPPVHHVGLFVLNPDGSFIYAHDGSESPTTDTFTYRVTDAAGANSNVATVTITIVPFNETPLAVEDAYDALEDIQLIVAAPGVLGNDTDAEDDTLTVLLPSTVPSAEGGDVAIAADGSFTYDPPADFVGTDSFTYEAIDATGSNTASNTVTVTITIGAVNDEPTFTLTEDPDQTVFEDSAAQSVAGFLTDSDAGAANESGQTLTLSVTNDDNALFSDQPAIDPATGDLSYTPAPDANGSVTVTVSISDDGGTANGGDDTSADQTFTITIDPVNDEPSFTKGGDVLVDEDSGAYGPTPWATDLSVGPANESAQTPTFTVTNDDNALFSVQPAVSATGELTFTPADDANGSATVTVFVSDDGGLPGDDTSPDQTFVITVAPANDPPVVALTTPLAEYVEGDGAVAIDAGPASFTVGDIDSAFLAGLTVQISNGAETGVDELACPACAGLGIVASFSSVSNTLTLVGPASPADYEAALQSVTFENASDTPSGADRELTVVANDGAADSTPVTMTFTFVVTGDIMIVKDAVPDDPQDFEFTEDITGGTFVLDDDPGSAEPNSMFFANVVPGEYAVTETIADGWDLVGLNCSDVDSTGDTLTATATIIVDAGELVTCTFTNDNRGTIEVVTDTDPDDAQDFVYDHDIIDAIPAVASPVTLDDDADGTLANTQLFENVAPGVYTVSQAPIAGWEISDIVCTGGASTFVYGVGNLVFVPGDSSATVTLAFGDDDVSCTFTNTETGTIEIVKETVGSDGVFTFTDDVEAPNTFALDTDEDGSTTFEDVTPGTYTVEELLPETGWDLTNIVCTSTATPASTFTYAGATDSPTAGFEPGDTSATITLAPGDDTVSCAFTNTQRGTITVAKATVGDTGVFSFTENTGGSALGFDLDTTGGVATEILTEVPGGNIYSVTETVPVGWDLTSLDCSNGGGTSTFVFQPSGLGTFQPGDTNVQIALAAGDAVDCDFENTKRGTIEIVKDTVGGDGDFDFTDDIPGSGAFTVATTENTVTETFENVVPGTYNVTETTQTGWDLTGLACVDLGDDGSSSVLATGVSTIDLDPGETVTCTYTNTARGTIEIIKDADPDDPQDFGFTTDVNAIPGPPVELISNGGFETGLTGWSCTGGDSCGISSDAHTGSSAVSGFDNSGFATLTQTIATTPGETYDFSVWSKASVDAGNVLRYSLDGAPPVTITTTAAYSNTTTTFVAASSSAAISLFFETDSGTGVWTIDDVSVTSPGIAMTSFTLDDDDDPTLSNTETFENVLPGTYSVTEGDPTPAFDLTDLTCVDPDGGSSVDLGTAEATIDLDPGETVSCTYTNTKRGTIEIVKSAVGGDEEFDFTDDTVDTPLGDFTIDTAAADTETFENVLAGTYEITELAEDGWDLTDLVCVDPDDGSSVNESTATIDLDPGETVSCTYTNTKRGTIEIVKSALGGDDTFSFTDDVPGSGGFDVTTTAGTITETITDVVPGTYTVTETPVPDGWDLTGVTCVDPDGGSSSVLATGVSTIDVDAGETVTCSYTNTRRGTIEIVKDTVGGDGSFGFTDDVADATPGSGFGLTTVAGTATETFADIVPGEYSVTEDDPTPGFDLTGLTCVDGGATSTGNVVTRAASIDLDPGETVTCTFTNTKRGSIEIVKTAVGGDEEFDFTDDVADATPGSGFSVTTVAGAATETFDDVAPATYTVAETAEAGWDLTDIECTSTGGSTFTYTGNGGADTGAFETGDTSANITLAAGDSTVSCEFTNTKRGSIEVVKTAVGGDDTFGFTDDVPISGAFDLTTVAGTASTTIADIEPSAYAITEAATAGWALSDIECTSTGGSTFTYTGGNPDPAYQQGDDTVNITLAPGDSSVSCEFTNIGTDMIELLADTVPDDAQDFSFTHDVVSTPVVSSPVALDDDGDGTLSNAQLFEGVAPGTYTITETTLAGWDLSIDCIGTAGFTYGSDSVDITFVAGDTASCTFTNVERGNITIVQDEDTLPVIGQNFTFDEDITPGSFQLDDDADLALPDSTDFLEVVPGTYTVSQRAELGWDLGSIECSSTGGSTFSYTGAAGDTDAFEPGDDTAVIDLAPGDDDVSCTFTNENQGTIEVIQDSLGDEDFVFDFTETIPTGTGTFDLDGNSGTDTETFGGVIPGVYTVTQAVPATGWDLTDIVCATSDVSSFTYLGGPDNVDDTVFEVGDTTVEINLAGADDSVSCTVTNTERGTIDITKAAVGDDGTFDFTDDTVGDPLGDFSLDTTATPTQSFTEVLTGTYVISETVPATGWDLTAIDCTNNGGTSTFLVGGDSVEIDLAPGDDVDCTFTNTKRGTIDITKTTVGGDGTFSFTDDIVGPGFDVTTPAAPTQNFTEVAPDVYTVTESTPAGWALTGIACTATGASTFQYLGGPDDVDDTVFEAGDTMAEITLAAADDADCTFENTQSGGISGLKFSDDNGDGLYDVESGVSDVELTLTGGALTSPLVTTTDGDGEFSFDDLAPGTYTVTETVPAGYTPTTPTSAVITIAAGEVAVALAGQATLAPTQVEVINAGLLFGNAPNGTIVIVKDADPDGPQVFDFTEDVTAGPALTPFTLVDDGIVDNSITFDDVTFGAYAVTETPIPAGWDLTGVSCVDPDGGSTGDTGTGIASVDLDPGETVTCTFTNTQDAFIVVDKVTDPAGDPAEFNFDASWIGAAGSDDFQLTDAADPFDSGDLDPGTYSVTELAEAGWDLTNTTCVSSLGDTETADDIDLDAGETVTCTFTNTKRGALTIVKDSDPEGPQDFTFRVESGGPGTTDLPVAEIEPNDSVASAQSLDGSGWNLAFNPDVGDTVANTSTTIPHVSVLGTGNDTFDSYSFTVANAGDSVIFDIDGAWGGGSFDSWLDLYDGAGTFLASNDDSSTSWGQGGSINSLDSYLEYTFSTPGVYVIRVGRYCCTLPIPTGGDYTLHVSLDDPVFGFTLDDDGETAISPDTEILADVMPGDDLTVTELATPGWDITGIECAGAEGTTFDIGETGVTANLAPGDLTATCTFTNTERGTIEIVKDSVGGDETFSFSEDITEVGTFDLVTEEGSASTTFTDVLPGTYVVAETALPQSWDLTNLECVSTNGGSTFSLTGSNVDTTAFEPGDDTATIGLAPGDDVICTFTNTDERGTINITKDAGESDGTFGFSETITAIPLFLSPAGEPATETFDDVDPGTYLVTELVDPGWELTDITCASSEGVSTFIYSGASVSPTTAFEPGDDTVQITLGAGADEVDCTFTNKDLRGEIEITKVAAGAGVQTFEFTEDILGEGSTFLGDGESETFEDVLAGATYSVTETQVPGWELTDIVCSSTGGSTFAYTGADPDSAFQPGDDTVEITLAPEDTDVSCTFTNTDRRGTIIIVKDAEPADGTVFEFTDDIVGEGPFSLYDDGSGEGDTLTFDDVVPGTYTVVEGFLADWVVSGLNCDDANSTGSNDGTRTATVNLEGSETVTCTFTNTYVGDPPPPIDP